jgi:hypothetical protein
MAGPIIGLAAFGALTCRECRMAAAADRARHEHAIAPDNRARVRKAGNRRPPEDMFAGLCVPPIGQVLAIRDASGEWPAK